MRLIAKGPPDEPTHDRYAATPKGVEHFRGWLQNTELPPMIRDALQCKLEFVEHEDLAGLLQIVRGEEQAYTCLRFRPCPSLAGTALARAQQAGGHAGQTAGYPAQRRSDAVGVMSKRLERLREELEELLERSPPVRARRWMRPLSVEGVWKGSARRAWTGVLEDVSFDVEPGEVVAIIGGRLGARRRC